MEVTHVEFTKNFENEVKKIRNLFGERFCKDLNPNIF